MDRWTQSSLLANQISCIPTPWRVRTCACLDSFGPGWDPVKLLVVLCTLQCSSLPPQARIWAEADVTRSRAQARQPSASGITWRVARESNDEMSWINSELITKPPGVLISQWPILFEGYIKYIYIYVKYVFIFQLLTFRNCLPILWEQTYCPL